MGQSINRNFYHNQNTHKAQGQTLRRMYCVPTSWNAPMARGIRQPGTDYITLLEAKTPEKGVGDPRVKGERIVYRGNTQTHVG